MLFYLHGGDALPWIIILPVALVVLVVWLAIQFGDGETNEENMNALSLLTSDDERNQDVTPKD